MLYGHLYAVLPSLRSLWPPWGFTRIIAVKAYVIQVMYINVHMCCVSCEMHTCGTYVSMSMCWLFLLLLCSNTERSKGGNFFGLVICGHSPLCQGERGGASLKLLVYVWGDQEGEKGDVSAQIAFPFAPFTSFQPQTFRWCRSCSDWISPISCPLWRCPHTHKTVLQNAIS